MLICWLGSLHPCYETHGLGVDELSSVLYIYIYSIVRTSHMFKTHEVSNSIIFIYMLSFCRDRACQATIKC